MNTAIKSVLIAAAIAGVSAPAMAQPINHRGSAPAPSFARVGFDLFQRIDRVQDRIDQGRATGRLDRREAARATRDLNEIRGDLSRATRGRYSLTPVMHARFDNRIDQVSGFVRAASNDRGHGHFRG